MKKTLALLLAVLMLLAALAACGGETTPSSNPAPQTSGTEPGDSSGEQDSELPSYNFNLGTMYYDPAASPDMNTDGMTTQYFVDLVNERSGGRVTITVHWASVLGGTTELFDQVRSGDLDMQFGGAVSSCDVRFGVFNIPNLMDDFDMSEALLVDREGGLYKIMYDIYQENNIELLSGSIGQFRGLFNNKREIHLPEDCRDLMLRAYADEVVTTYWNGLCNTTIMAISEVYTGLQLGTIDGLEFWPTAMIANGYTDVLDYYSDLYWQWQSNSNLTMNKELYDSLDPETQQLLKDCAYEAAGVYYRQTEEANMEGAYEYMESHGISVYELTDEERAAWEEYGTSLQPQFREIVGAETYDAVMEVVEAYRAAQ